MTPSQIPRGRPRRGAAVRGRPIVARPAPGCLEPQGCVPPSSSAMIRRRSSATFRIAFRTRGSTGADRDDEASGGARRCRGRKAEDRPRLSARPSRHRVPAARLAALRNFPAGDTVSYADVARRIGVADRDACGRRRLRGEQHRDRDPLPSRGPQRRLALRLRLGCRAQACAPRPGGVAIRMNAGVRITL